MLMLLIEKKNYILNTIQTPHSCVSTTLHTLLFSLEVPSAMIAGNANYGNWFAKHISLSEITRRCKNERHSLQ
jgi:hypothetical protein